MALQFSETAPGVHTSSILNPKTDKRHNIAIIESCDVWQLFIDGELAVRDLPSFKAAVAAAEAKAAAPRTSNMVRAACALVVLSLAGASTIGLSKVLSPLLSTETAVAAVSAQGNEAGTAHRFARVRPASGRAAVAAPRAQSTSSVVVEKVVVTPSAAPAAPGGPKVGVGTPPSSPTSTVAKAARVQPKSVKPAIVVADAKDEGAASEVPVLGLKPIVPGVSLAAKGRTRLVRPAPQSGAPAPVVINARQEPAQQSEAGPKDLDLAQGDVPPVPQPAGVEAGDQQVVAIAPPLPGKAPVRVAPVIRSASQPIAPERMRSILAELEVAAREPVTRSAGPAKTERRTIKRRVTKRRARPTKTRRARRAARRSFRHAHRHGPVYHAAPAPRMVCFGHTCRFR